MVDFFPTLCGLAGPVPRSVEGSNLAGRGMATEAALEEMLRAHQARRHDELVACTEWKHWLDEQRRVVRNAFGALSHPESEPDWSLLH
jgi:hypothetical protein